MTGQCPTPQKAGYPDRRTAGNAMKSILRRHTLKAPTDAYLCRCGKWHLTTRARVRGRRR